jgi:hypothetical protein
MALLVMRPAKADTIYYYTGDPSAGIVGSATLNFDTTGFTGTVRNVDDDARNIIAMQFSSTTFLIGASLRPSLASIYITFDDGVITDWFFETSPYGGCRFAPISTLMEMAVTNKYLGGYWEDQGYNWFSGS